MRFGRGTMMEGKRKVQAREAINRLTLKAKEIAKKQGFMQKSLQASQQLDQERCLTKEKLNRQVTI